ncbi:MAG: hypothetical protein VX910_02560 [Candidatus Latescibacterota bacterium]|nr:hypothetical protein [Candidatus Latescibacterota bacterium]
MAVAIWCFAIIVERTQTGVYKQLTWYVREIFSGEIDHLSGIGKFKLYQNTFSLFEEAQRPIFGVGPGNYNSRVAYAKKGNYLTSGYFKRVEYGFLPPQSEYTRKYVHVHKVVGVRNSPLASLVSILAEYGFAGLVVFLLYGASVYRYLGKLSMMGDETGSSLALGLQLGSAVILFLFFMEAWLEYPKVMILYWSFVALCIVCSREPAREQPRDALT